MTTQVLERDPEIQNQIRTSEKHFHHFNLNYLKEMIQEDTIPIDLAEKLLHYWQKRLSDASDLIYQNFFEYYLFFESLHCGILSATLLRTSDYHIMHQYGILNASMEKVFTRIKHISDETKNNSHSSKKEFQVKEKFIYENNFFNLWLRSFIFQGEEYVVAVLYPTHISIEKNLTRMQDMFCRFYLPDAMRQDIRFDSLFEKYSLHVTEVCNACLQKEKTVTFAYIRFNSFKKYLSHIGENYSKLILTDLQNFLKSKLQEEKGDLLLTLNTQEFLLVFLDQEYNEVKNIFQHLPIRVKNMLLPYKIKVAAFHSPFNSLISIWQEIKI